MNSNKEKRSEALAKAQSIVEACREAGVPLDGDHLRKFDAHLADAERLAVSIQADAAREPFRSVLGPRDRGENHLGKWLLQELRTVVPTSAPGASLDPSIFYNAPVATLAPESVFLGSGVQILNIGNGAQSLTIPYFSADPTAGAVAAAGTISASDPTAGTAVARPRSYKVRTRVAREILEDLTPETAQSLSESLIRSISTTLDAAFFEGSGSGENITGLKNISSTGGSAISTNGATPADFDFLSLAFQTLRVGNATPRAIYCHPRSWGTIERLKVLTTGSNQPLLAVSTPNAIQRSTDLNLFGVPVYLTTAIGTAEAAGTSGNVCSSLYVVDTSRLFTVWRSNTSGDAAIKLDAVRDGETDTTDLIATVRCDLAAPQPSAIVRVSGIKA